MTIDQIKAAVDAGESVYWKNTAYRVFKDRLGQYLIGYRYNGHKTGSVIGLTNRAGDKLNGAEKDFFIA